MKTNRKTKKFKDKALQIIDCLTMIEDEEMLFKTERLEKHQIIARFKKFISEVYKISHAAVDRNCSHVEWENKILETEKTLKKMNYL